MKAVHRLSQVPASVPIPCACRQAVRYTFSPAAVQPQSSLMAAPSWATTQRTLEAASAYRRCATTEHPAGHMCMLSVRHAAHSLLVLVTTYGAYDPLHGHDIYIMRRAALHQVTRRCQQSSSRIAFSPATTVPTSAVQSTWSPWASSCAMCCWTPTPARLCAGSAAVLQVRLEGVEPASFPATSIWDRVCTDVWRRVS